MKLKTLAETRIKELRNKDRFGVYVKTSEELYNLLKEFCDETGIEINGYGENCVLESINSGVNGKKSGGFEK